MGATDGSLGALGSMGNANRWRRPDGLMGSSRERIIGLMVAIVGSMEGAVVGLMGAIVGSMGLSRERIIGLMLAIVGLMGAVEGSMGAVVGSVGAVVGSVGRSSERRLSEVMVQCWPDMATIAKGSRVLAAAGMSWEGEAHGGRRRMRQRQGTWPPMAGGINN